MVDLPIDYYVTNHHSTRAMSRLTKNTLKSTIKSKIDETVIKVVSKYKNGKNRWKTDGPSQLLDDDYSYAPYDFQRIFKRHFEKYLTVEFKTPIRKKIPRHTSFSPEDITSIDGYLNDLIRTFPGDMDFMNDTYQDWDDTARLSLECNQDLFLKLVDEFWGIFSKNLRITHFENIPESEILRWKTKLLSEEFPTYQNQLAIERKRLLKIWNSGYTPNEKTMNIVKKMNQISFEGTFRGK